MRKSRAKPAPPVSPRQESTSPSIREWERAGAMLGIALQKYVEQSQILETNALNDGTSPDHLATRIDCAIRSLHLIVDQNIAQARSTLVRTRNRMASPILRLLPEEVLSQIFDNVIFAPVDLGSPPPMSKSLTGIYRSLHTLLGVCSAWRNIILAEGRFWSLVPVIDWNPSPLAFKFKHTMELSFQRAGNRPLHLAAIRGTEWINPQALAENASRFRSVNITAESHIVISSMLEPFLTIEPNRTLSDLSIRVENKQKPQNNLPIDINYLFPFQTFHRESFAVLLGSLSVVRVWGIPIRWSQVVFSNRLVELHLQDVSMGYDIEMIALLNVLASATELRSLKFITVRTFRDPTTETLPHVDLILPSLQSLLVQDLYSNTLALILGSISSRSHDLTLILNHKCIQYLDPEFSQPSETDFDDLHELLANIPVKELLLDAESFLWLEASELATVMTSLPNLEILRLYFWTLDGDCCKALERPLSAGSNLQNSFPCLKNLHFSSCNVPDEQAFRAMVSSHCASLECISLGVSIRKLWIDEALEWDTLSGGDELAFWAGQNVPNLLLGNPHEPLEFQLPEWELW